MPLYEYQCDDCATRFERIQRFSDPPIAVCPSCGGPVKKLLSSPAIQFKGSGWYITDYAKKGASGKEGGKDGDKEGAKEARTDAGKDTQATGRASGGGETGAATGASASSSESAPSSTTAPAKSD